MDGWRILDGLETGASNVHERNYLWTFVQRLRRKLEDDPKNPTVIVSAGSRGYRLGDP